MNIPTTDTSHEPDRPRIAIDEAVYDRLRRLAGGAQARTPAVAAALLDELDRAEIVSATRLPVGVVTIGSVVTYLDCASRRERTVRLVYPPEADIARDRVSVLTPVGAALIGLSNGDEMTWQTRDGTERRLRIVSVSPPECDDATSVR